MTQFKLQKIDELLLSQHSCLDKSDHCYFFGDYASRQGYNHSIMNQLIFNLKKEMDRKGKSEWSYKEEAIKTVANLFVENPNWNNMKQYTWIPFPPSKIKSDPKYDDRLLRVLESMQKKVKDLDIKEMLISRKNREAAHLAGPRSTIEDHLRNLDVRQEFKSFSAKSLIIFDDVITTGASFKAAQKILSQYFPTTPIIGIFIARSAS